MPSPNLRTLTIASCTPNQTKARTVRYGKKFDLNWELSKEETLKAGPLAEKVEKACKDLTRVYGRWKNPPPLFYHHIDCTPDGWYIDGSFVWDETRYRSEDFREDPRKELYEPIIQRKGRSDNND